MATSKSTEDRVPTYMLCNNDTIRKAARNLGRLYDDVLAPSSLKSTQFSVMVHIDELKEPTIKSLAKELVMDESALGHTLKPLIREGLVRLVPHPKDRRSKLVTLTKLGQDKLVESSVLWLRAQRNLEDLIGAEKAAALRTALVTLTSNDFASAFEALISTGALLNED